MALSRKLLLCLFFLFAGLISKSQIGGTFNIPSDFPTIAAAVQTLNVMGVASGVTINVTAGHTETVGAGGLRLQQISGATSTSQVIFRKSGTGANPLLTAYTGTADPTYAMQDGVWWFIGTDYVTIDGIDITDPNTSGNDMMEFGYGLFKASAQNACQYNTIKNCVITLNRNNMVNTPYYSPGGARGINLAACVYTNQTTAVTNTVISGASIYNSFYSNTIQNCLAGITLLGASVTNSIGDVFNDVGGQSAATGNTLVNFGGGTGNSPAYGVFTAYQFSLNVSYNVVNNHNGSGAVPQQPLYGIYTGYSNYTTMVTVAHNTISVNNTNTLNLTTYGIYDVTIPGSSFGSRVSANVFPQFNVVGGTSGNVIFSGGYTIGKVQIDSNYIGNITLGSNANFQVIHSENSNTLTISGNTIAALSASVGNIVIFDAYDPNRIEVMNNVVSNVSFSASASNSITCIFPGSVGSGYFHNNIFENFTGGGTSTSMMKGIVMNGGSGTREVINNVIRNWQTFSGCPGGFNFRGIEVLFGTGYTHVDRNQIYDISSVATNTNSSIVFDGLFINGYSAGADQNKIAGLSFNSAGSMYLVRQSGSGVTGTYVNNILGDVDCPNASVDNLFGFNIQSGSASLYYNSIYLNSTANSSGNLGSAVVSFPSTGTITARNNILVNVSASAGSGISRIYRFPGTNMNGYGDQSSNNIMYVGTTGTANVVAAVSFGSYFTTLSSFQASVAPRDNNSAYELPPFISTVASATNFLNIDPNVPTRVEGTGLPFAFTYTADYADSPRHPITPDIGAWEGNYIQADFFAPAIVTSGFVGSACNTSGRTLTVSLSDASGVATGSLSPRLYYRKNFSLYSSTQGSLSTGTSTSGVWTFSLSYSASAGDLISYFLVAQDNSTLNNVIVYPSNNYTATDVNNVSAPPNPAQTYSIVSATLNGTYNVGSGQTYTSLTQAAQAYNTSCLSGPVTFSLTDGSYSTNETFPITFQLNSDASSTNSLLIMPGSSVSGSVVGSSTSIAVFKFLDARYITLSGNNSSSSLLIQNANTSTSTAIWLASGTGPLYGNNNITLSGLSIRGGTNTLATNYGVLSAANATSITSPSVAMNNDYISIEGNNFYRLGTGVYAIGTSSVPATGPDHWSISSNTIGGITTGTNNFSGSGIYLKGISDFTVSNNTIRNGVTSAANMAAIMLKENANAGLVSMNSITGFTSTASCCVWPMGAGIYLGVDINNTSVSRNQLTGIANDVSAGEPMYGIYCDLQNGAGVKINNNMISNVFARSDDIISEWPVGIMVAGISSGVEIDFNTVNMGASYTGHPNSLSVPGAAAVLFNTTGGNHKLRNNILSSTIDFTNHTNEKIYSFYCATSPTIFASIDYNNYYAGGPALNMMAYAGQDLPSLAALSATVGGNVNSTTLAPVFVSSTDAHLQSVSANAHLDNTGSPVSGITIDFDGQSRSASAPDIGADEFSSATCTGVATGTISTTSYSVCSGNSISLVAATSGTDSGITYQWQVSQTSGGTYTSVPAPSSLTLALQPSVAGTLYYRMKSTCSVNSASAVTNEAVLTTYGTPSTTLSASSTSLCAGNNFTLNGNASISSSFSWLGPLSFNSTSQNPVISNAATTASGLYTMVATSGPCSSSPLTISVTVSANPTVSVTGNTLICAGKTTTLTATGSTTYSWSTGSAVATMTVNPVVNTSYTVTGTFTNGCFSTKTVAVQTNSIPVISVSAGAGSVCIGSSASFTANGASTYTWNTNATGSVLTVTPSSVSVYTVNGASGAGCLSSATIATGIYTLPVLSISSTTNTACAGSSVGLSATGAVSYTWSPGNFPGASVTVNPLSTTAYTLQGMNAEGCISRINTTITTLARPSISVSDGTVCVGNSFVMQPSGASTYTFSSGSATVAPLNSTVYTVYGTSSAGCLSTNTAVVNVSVAPLPTITVNSGTLCSGRIFTLSPGGAASYTYSSGSPYVSPLANSSYSVTGASVFGCVSASAAVANVSVFASPTIAVSGGSICSGQSFTFYPTGAFNYFVSGGSSIVSPVNTTSYNVSGVDAVGCISINTVVATVTVFASPTVGAANGTVCIGNSFTLQPTGAASYSYSSGSPVVTPANTTTYSVYGVSSVGCVSSNTIVVSVSVAPLPTISVNSGSLCSGRTFTLVPTGATNYFYSSSSQFVSPTANTDYSVTGTSAFGCASTNTAVASITVFSSPTIAVSGGTICSGQSFVFNPTGALTYSVSGGSSTVSPSNTTTYNVTGVDAVGCISINTVVATVSVFATPTVAFSGGSVCEGSSFTLQPSGASNYTVSGGTLTVTPALTSTYVLVGSSTAGCVSPTVSAVVAVVPVPTITVNNGTICAGQSFTINPSGAPNYSFAGGSSIVSPNTSASYTVVGFNNLGCASANTGTVFVTVNPLPQLTISGPVSFCAGSVATITASGATSYSWVAGGQASTQTISPLVNTVYTVTGADNNGCINTAQRSVTVEALPTMAITGNTSICQGAVTNLYVSGSAITYTWSTGTIGNLMSATPPTSTVYTAYGSGLNGCVGNATVLVFVNSLPFLQANATSTSICIGDQVTLSGSGASSYTWSGGISDNVPFSPTQSNSYTLSAIALNGCKGHTTVLVVVNPLPVIMIAGPVDSVCIGSTVELVASGANIYSWEQGGGTPSATITPVVSEVYKVTGTDINGCVSSATFALNVSECVGLEEHIAGLLSVYPNPSSGVFNISLPALIKDAGFFVTNYLSQKIGEGNFETETTRFDLGEKAKGLYFVHLTVRGKTQAVIKVIVD